MNPKLGALNAFLFAVASIILYAAAIVAYILFYHNYLPDQITTLPVHLQYGYSPHPYGIVSLAPLPNLLDYDVSVSLSLPRSPPNLAHGNFMISLYLLDRSGSASTSRRPSPFSPPHSPANPPPDAVNLFSDRRVLHVSSRPAIIPYTDPLVAKASRLLFLPYHIFAPHSENARLDVPMADAVSSRGTPPSALYLELQAGQSLQVYEAVVTLAAQLKGLRWFMWHYPITAWATMTTSFWLVSVVTAGLTWFLLSQFFDRPEDAPEAEAPEAPLDPPPDLPQRRFLRGGARGRGLSARARGKLPERGAPARTEGTSEGGSKGEGTRTGGSKEEGSRAEGSRTEGAKTEDTRTEGTPGSSKEDAKTESTRKEGRKLVSAFARSQPWSEETKETKREADIDDYLGFGSVAYPQGLESIRKRAPKVEEG